MPITSSSLVVAPTLRTTAPGLAQSRREGPPSPQVPPVGAGRGRPGTDAGRRVAARVVRVIVHTLVAPLLGTNCYLLEAADGRCLVVDPGAGVVEDLVALVRDAGLRPVGLLATHGHVDHTWSAGALCRVWDVPLVVHAADAYRLADPFGTLGPLGPQLRQLGAALGGPPSAPERVVELGDERMPLGPDADLRVRALHCPGHTEGSTVFLVDHADGSVSALTGDVLFAGTVGRTDLPGGDPVAMRTSLERLAGLDPAVGVLPGHGPRSTLATELRSNPYLRRD